MFQPAMLVCRRVLPKVNSSTKGIKIHFLQVSDFHCLRVQDPLSFGGIFPSITGMTRKKMVALLQRIKKIGVFTGTGRGTRSTGNRMKVKLLVMFFAAQATTDVWHLSL